MVSKRKAEFRSQMGLHGFIWMTKHLQLALSSNFIDAGETVISTTAAAQKTLYYDLADE